MACREDRRWGRGYETEEREEMESSCLDGYMEASSWNAGCCTLWNMVLEDLIRAGCGVSVLGGLYRLLQGDVHDGMTSIFMTMLCLD